MLAFNDHAAVAPLPFRMESRARPELFKVWKIFEFLTVTAESICAHDLPERFAGLHERAHFLNLGCLLFDGRRESYNFFL